MTKIEWANETWNPITGCDPISEGCKNCYAARMAKRLAGRFGYPAKEPFRITFHDKALNKPYSWEHPKMVFVSSMGDLFHEDVKDEWLDKVFSVITGAFWHYYLILTKRPERMRDYMYGRYDYDELSEGYSDSNPLKNIWLGVTAENQDQADKRIPLLLEVPAAKHFVSVEPMLGEVRLDKVVFPDCDEINVLKKGNLVPPWDGRRLDWVICGAETGPGKRPMEDSWAESLRDQCAVAGVPFFFKKDSSGAGSFKGNVYHNYPME